MTGFCYVLNGMTISQNRMRCIAVSFSQIVLLVEVIVTYVLS